MLCDKRHGKHFIRHLNGSISCDTGLARLTKRTRLSRERTRTHNASNVLTQQGKIQLLVHLGHALLELLHNDPRRTQTTQILHQNARDVVLVLGTLGRFVDAHIKTVVLLLLSCLDQRQPGIPVGPKGKGLDVLAHSGVHALQKLGIDSRLLTRVLLRIQDKLGVKVDVDATLDTMLERTDKDATNRRVDLVLRVGPSHVDNVKGKVILRNNLPAIPIRLRQMTEDVEDKTAR